MGFTIPEFEFKGIPKIEIPRQDYEFAGKDFGMGIIKKYISKILQAHEKNSKKIDHLYNYYLGLQDILAKNRLYNKDKKNNNKLVENHAYRQVVFKRGFLTGERREYTHKSDTKSDDLTYLDRYFTDCSFFSGDKDLKEWIFSTGVGCTHAAPRVDIIVSDGIDELTKTEKMRYMTKEEGFDVNFNAPFTFATLDPRENFVVYSSNFAKTPLFCVSIVDIDVGDEDKIELRKEVHIETRYASFVIQTNNSFTTLYGDLMLEKSKSIHYLPMIEHCVNNSRLGVVELNKDIFNLTNTLISSIVDMTVDNALGTYELKRKRMYLNGNLIII